MNTQTEPKNEKFEMSVYITGIAPRCRKASRSFYYLKDYGFKFQLHLNYTQEDLAQAMKDALVIVSKFKAVTSAELNLRVFDFTDEHIKSCDLFDRRNVSFKLPLT
jgi:hypothetical protein